MQCKVYTYLTIVQFYICKSCVGKEQCYKQSEGGIGNDPELASTGVALMPNIRFRTAFEISEIYSDDIYEMFI